MADCKTCEFQFFCAMPDFVRNDLKRCKVYQEKKLQSQADRIRAMSDEELAKILFGSCLEVMGREQCNSFHNEGCEKCVVQWLKSEVKE